MENRNFQIWIAINVVMGLTGYYGYTILRSQEFSDKTGISYLIIGLFGLFYILNVINTLYYNEEHDLLAQEEIPKYNPEIDDIEFEGSGLLATHVGNLSDIYKIINK